MIRLGVGKRRLILLFVVVLVIVMIRLPKVDAAVNEFKADSWTDSAIEWTDDALAYDGDWGTAAYDLGVAGGDDYPSNYASGFDSANSGTGTISQLDIIVRLSVSGLSGSSDWWQLTLDVGASTDNALSGSPMYDQVLTNLTYTDVTEPNGGGWSWSEIWSAQVHFDTERVGGADGADVYIYEYSFRVTTVSGTDYTAYPSGSLALGGTTALVASFSKTLVEGFALVGITALAVAFVVTLIQGFTVVGTAALAGIYSKTLIEGFALAGTTSVFVIIQILIVEGFALAGGVSLVAAFVVTLVQGFALGGTTALVVAFVVTLIQGFSLGGTVSAAVAYVKTLIEGFSLTGTITAFKVLIVSLVEGFTVGVGVDITAIVGTSLIGSIFFQLFLGVNLWSYLGPMALVVGGYFAMKKDTGLGVIWFMVEVVVMAQYFALVEATPEYWWSIFIIMLGSLFTIAFPLWGGKK